MGMKVKSLRGVSVVAGVNIFGNSIILSTVELKMLFTVAPQDAGILSIVRIDGLNTRVAQLFNGNALTPFANNLWEASCPKFYSEVSDQILYNFRYSVDTVFDIFTLYTEKEHARVLL